MENLEDDISRSINVLKNGGIILYPTDTIWGIGCDATNEKAVKKIYLLKKRDEKKSMIILLSTPDEIKHYVSNPSKKLLSFLSLQKNPTTAIFEHAINFTAALINKDGTIAIRIPDDEFCKLLLKKSMVPLVSTSANISEDNYPRTFAEISEEIKKGVDYIVQHRQSDLNIYPPSAIVKLNDVGAIEKLR